MNRLLSTLIILATCTTSYAQSYKMVDTSMPKEEATPIIKYDSLSNIFPYLDHDYYKQFIGQSILFYPRNPKSQSIPEYFANFITPNYKVMRTDTIWLKRRKNPKPKDYELRNAKSDLYKPTRINDKEVALCGASRNDGYVFPFYYYEETYSKKTHSGYYTPYYEIEGKSFKIIEIEPSGSIIKPTIFTLLDENNDTILWNAHPGRFGRNSINEINYNDFYPIIVTGFIKKMEQLYLNKELYIKSSKIIKYKCIDIVYAGEANNYMVPSFVIKNNTDERIIPLTKVPDILSYKIDTHSPLFSTPCFTDLGAIPAKEYEDQIEKERIAKAEKLEKERIAKANAEKERALATQKRAGYLNKKYGARIGKMILNGEVQTGMTREMCEEAWGSPQKINTTTTTQTVSEQWVYGGHSYLYFTNGRLTAIQN